MNLNNKRLLNSEMTERIRTLYPAGCRVELIELNDDYASLSPGMQGTVAFVDSVGTIFVDWDCGSGLGVIYGVDRIRKL